MWPVRGGGGQDAAAEPGNRGAAGQESPRRRASGNRCRPKGSGKPEPSVAFLVDLIGQDPDITPVGLQAALLAAHGVSFSTSGIDALLRRHGCTYIWLVLPSCSPDLTGLSVGHEHSDQHAAPEGVPLLS